jgi:hypothetical protein
MFDTRLRMFVRGLAAVGVLVLGACGGDDDDPAQDDDRESSTDVDAMEEELAVNLAEDVDQPTPEVDCPDDVEPVEGEQFECTGTAQDGGQFTIEVTWNEAQGEFDAYVPPEQFG